MTVPIAAHILLQISDFSGSILDVPLEEKIKKAKSGQVFHMTFSTNNACFFGLYQRVRDVNHMRWLPSKFIYEITLST
jgi:hypothetical protein